MEGRGLREEGDGGGEGEGGGPYNEGLIACGFGRRGWLGASRLCGGDAYMGITFRAPGLSTSKGLGGEE